MAWFGDFIDWWHDNGLIPGIWKGITGQQSNEKINEENIAYQRERNAIEDARYAEETAYNRAFAENERDYQRQLQQEIFNRADTAYARQAADMASVGINPLSMNMSGSEVGQAMPMASEPSMSGRGGQALRKDLTGVNATSALLSLADTFNGIETGKYERDSLALQNDAQFLENLSKAASLGLEYRGLFPSEKDGGYRAQSRKGKQFTFYGDDGLELFDRDYYKQSLGSKFKKDYLDTMPDWVKSLNAFGDESIYNNAEKALIKASNLFDKASSNLFDKADKNSFNPFRLLLQMFQ